MKKIINSVMLLAGLVTLFACEKKTKPEDEQPKIIEASFTSLENKGVESADALNIFSIEASNAAGDKFSAKFIGSRSFLPAGTYRLGTSNAANTYKDASFNGKAISEGEIEVSKDEDNYTLSAVTKLSDGTILKISAAGTLKYEKVIPDAQHIYSADCTPGENGVFTWDFKVYSLAEEEEACFQFMSESGETPAGTYQIVGLDGIGAGKALQGYDLSILGMGKGGCYYVKEGKTYFLVEGCGDVTISEEDGMYSVEVPSVKCLDASQAEPASEIGTTLSYLYCKWGEVTPPAPEYEPIVVAGGKYTETTAAKDSFDEHTLLFKDAEDNIVGQVVIRTASGAETIDGEYVFSAEEKSGTLAGGLDLSALGMGVVGSYYVKEGVNYTLSGGNAKIENSALGLNVVLSEVVSASGETQGTASPVSFLMMAKEEADPDSDPTDGVFTYTHTSEAKEGYSEHTISVYFSNGKQFLNLLVAVADGSAVAGDNIFVPVSYTITSTDQWTADPKGLACPGFNFLGIMDLGCYYTSNGTVNYLTEGVVRLVENADGLVVSIVDAEGNAIEGLPASLALLSATKKAE